MSSSKNPMLEPRITKVTVNIGVGESGERLLLAERVLTLLTGMTPVRTISRTTNRDLKVREGSPIGCKVTMRNQEKIAVFLKNALWARDNTLPAYNFDAQGNLSFGVADYTDFAELKYDPEMGIYGMDINVVLERPGHRVSRRRKSKHSVNSSHWVSQSESQDWFREKYGITIMEE
jgi:large subunit ribosomal protein L5